MYELYIACNQTATCKKCLFKFCVQMCMTCIHCCILYLLQQSCSNNDHPATVYHNLMIQFVLELCIQKHQRVQLYKLWLFNVISFYACSSTCCSTIKVVSSMRIWLVTLHMTVFNCNKSKKNEFLFVLWIEHKRFLKVYRYLCFSLTHRMVWDTGLTHQNLYRYCNSWSNPMQVTTHGIYIFFHLCSYHYCLNIPYTWLLFRKRAG